MTSRLSLVALAILLAASTAVAQDQASDCAVVEKLYVQSGLTLPWIQGKCCSVNTGVFDGWISCTSYPSYYGYSGSTTSPQSRISYIILSRQGFVGPIPELASLTALVQITLDGNQLTGQIPPLANLTALYSFDVSNNNLTGYIPPLSTLKYLSTFRARSNRLTGTIPSISATNLETLDLADNQLTGPVPLLDVQRLVYLNLQKNALTGGIPSFSSLANAVFINLSQNQLSGTIPVFSGMQKLQYLLLGSNNLVGQIPQLLGVPSLLNLTLSDNKLSGSIPSLNGITRVGTLDLARNNLTGTVPETITSLYALENVDLSGNALQGPMPDLRYTSSLTNVTVSGNSLSGTLEWVSGLQKLLGLNASHNRFYGAVPAFSDVKSLQSLDLSWNALSGQLPNLSALVNLTFIDVSGNFALTGSADGLLPLNMSSCATQMANQLACSSNVTVPCSTCNTWIDPLTGQPALNSPPGAGPWPAVAGVFIATTVILFGVVAFLVYRMRSSSTPFVTPFIHNMRKSLRGPDPSFKDLPPLPAPSPTATTQKLFAHVPYVPPVEPPISAPASPRVRNTPVSTPKINASKKPRVAAPARLVMGDGGSTDVLVR